MSDRVKLVHGGGGEATAGLIKEIFWSRFNNPELQKGNDAASFSLAERRLAVTTDAFVVTPWNFPGGDIGKLAVCGTVNDLTMVGAEPLGITAAFVIEEGFGIEDLTQIAQSMADTSRKAGVPLLAGDTKVVNRGAADGIFITTSGVGAIAPGINLGGELARPGDRVLITGTLGDHGATILMARGDLGLNSELQSDVAALNQWLLPIVYHYKDQIRVMRDPTRGGLATTLNEIARQSQVVIQLEEKDLPVKAEVRGLTELLGLDPLYLANEGKAIIIADPAIADHLLTRLRSNQLGKAAMQIGTVEGGPTGLVYLKTNSGGERVIPLGSGELLPRIC